MLFEHSLAGTMGQLPFSMALPRLRRALSEGQSHLALDGRRLCDQLKLDDSDDECRGLEAIERANCPDCQLIGRRFWEGLEAECQYAKQSLGPLGRLLAYHIDDDAPLFNADELAQLESRSFYSYLLALVGAVFLAIFGLDLLAVCWAVFSSGLRLLWLLGRPAIEQRLG